MSSRNDQTESELIQLAISINYFYFCSFLRIFLIAFFNFAIIENVQNLTKNADYVSFKYVKKQTKN